MNCHQIRAKIAQMTDGAPAPEVMAHARECAACARTLNETLGQQKWLQERFDEVSAHLLAHAPPFSGLDFREHSERSAWRAPLPLAWAAVLLVAAVIGWWTWTSLPTGPSKSSFAEEPVKRPTDRATPPAKPDPIAPLSGLNAAGPTAQSSWLAETSPLPTLPEEHAPSQHSVEPAVPETSPKVATSALSSPANSLDTGVYKMQPTAFAPDANGYLAAIIPNDAADQTPRLAALSLNGLPTESDFYIRTRDVGGNYVWLGSGRTDITGSAVVVMLRGSPTRAGRPLTIPATATQPPVTLNFDGTTGGDLVVVDASGDVLLTAAPTTAPTPAGSP